MKKRSLLARILVIANALLITAAFVGCPGRKNSTMVTIAPPPMVTIAPYGGNVQHFLPSDQTSSPPSQDPRSDKRSP